MLKWVPQVVRVIAAVIVLPLGLHADHAQAQSGTLLVHHIVVAPAETLAVHQQGTEGDVVVIVPALLGSHVSFRHVMAQLELNHTQVYVVDLLGFGSSTRPKEADYSFDAQASRLEAVFDSIGATSVVLVCHALAGPVCYRTAHRDAAVRALVSINGAPAEIARTNGITSALKFAPILKFFGAERIARGKVRSGLIKASLNPSWVTDDVLAAYLAPFRGKVFSMLDILRRMERSHEPGLLAPLLLEMPVPVELLVSRAGDGAAMTVAELEILQTVPGLVVTHVMDAGQYVQEENPAAVTAAVMRALDIAAATHALTR
jgi:pimeloyl-ACP methyl ester carboxylesterase